MKKYEFKVALLPSKYDSLVGIEKWLLEMQENNWEFVTISPAKVSNGYSLMSPIYIFRRELSLPNIKEGIE